MDKNATLKELERVLGFLDTDELTADQAKTITEDTEYNYDHYFNPGWMDFRKSCTPDGTTMEWADDPEHVMDVNGVPYIDLIGGFGTYICGHRNNYSDKRYYLILLLCARRDPQRIPKILYVQINDRHHQHMMNKPHYVYRDRSYDRCFQKHLDPDVCHS